MTEAYENENHGNTLTWQPGDVLFDLYEVHSVFEGLGENAVEKSCHRGGFGQVYKVYHRGWNLEMAMKVPLPEVFENRDQVLDFTRECEAWIDLGLHPQVVTCYYVRNLSGQPLVFAEYLSGGSLKEWIASGQLYEGGHSAALKRILDIAIQSARGLHYAHEKGLVHQDVKPANIMLTPEGQAKISDFGTARARAKAAAGTVSVNPGTILVSRGGMTPAYCSPEQSLGEKLTRRTDIWSWGLTVLEMFTGEVTWASGVAAAQTLEGYLRHGGDLEEIPPMPRDLAHLLERCFSGEQDRPHNFGLIETVLAQVYRLHCGDDYPRAEPKAVDDYADSLNNRAISLHDLGQQEEAEQLWREALKHDPAHLAAIYNLGLIEWRSGRIGDTVLVQRLESLRQGQPTARSTYLLAMVQAERCDYRSALNLLKEAAAGDGAAYEVRVLHKKLLPLENRGAECMRTFKGHNHGVSSVCLSADARYALSGNYDETLTLWAVDTGECLRTFEGHTKGVNTVCLSADGRYALSGSYDETLKLWDVKTGDCLRTFKGHNHGVSSVCLSADARYALSGSFDDTLKLWAVETGECLRTYKGHNSAVWSVCMGADGRYALSGSGDFTLKLWEIKKGWCQRTFEGHIYSVNSVCLSTDGRYALSGSLDETLKIWDVETGDCLRTFEGHDVDVESVCLSADGLYALSGSEDRTLKLWSVATGKCLRTFEGHTETVNSVCLSADGRYALSGSEDKTLKLWCIPWLSTGKRVVAGLEASLIASTEEALTVERAFNHHLTEARESLQAGNMHQAMLALHAARTLPGRMRDRRVLELWSKLYTCFRSTRLIDGWSLRTFEGHTETVNSVCLSADGRYALSGSGDKTLKLWALDTGECLRTFAGHTRWVASVCLSSDGCYALSGSEDKTLKLWAVDTGECLRTFAGHNSYVTSVCLGADGRYALSGSDDFTLKLWAVDTGECLRTFAGHTYPVNSVCLSRDSRYALSGSNDRTLKLWSVETGECLRTFAGHTGSVKSACLSVDGRYALSGSRDYTLKLWSVETGECLRTFKGHTSWVRSVCLSADGRYALSGSYDKTLKLWSVETGECLRTFAGYTSSVTSVCLSADGRYALSGSWDFTLKLWELYWELDPDETA